MAGLRLLSLNSHSHKKMFVTVTSSTVRPMAFSTKTNEIFIRFQRVPCARADLVGGAYHHSARMRDDSCAGLVWYPDPGHDHVCTIFADSAPSNVVNFPS